MATKGRLKSITKVTRQSYEQLTKDPNTLYVKDMFIDTPEHIIDLVKNNTDYANEQQAGVVKIANDGGIQNSSSAGLSIKSASASDIRLGSNNNVITASNAQDLVRELVAPIYATKEDVEGRPTSFTYATLSAMLTAFNITTSETSPQNEYSLGNTTTIVYNDKTYTLREGDVIYIVDTDVPDYWVSVSTAKIYKMETQKVDLSGYYTSAQVDSKLEEKENVLTAGANVQITRGTGNDKTVTISATDTTYEAVDNNSSEPGLLSIKTYEDVAANTAARHTHSNKAVLDDITSNDLSIIRDQHYKFMDSPNTDLNTLVHTGNYGIYGNCTHLPFTPTSQSAYVGALLVLEKSTKYVEQILFKYSSGEIWKRSSTISNNTQWSEWVCDTKQLSIQVNTLSTKVNNKIRTVFSEPEDFENGQYIFLVEEE